jgi:RimJ/RimL family protein N-acetyltransferase
VHTDAEALTYLQNGIFKSYAENGYGFYQVDMKEGNTPIGICGIVNRGTLPGPDFGFAFMPEYMGKGYATEASLAVLEHVKSDLGINELYAITLPDNQPSIRLLEKLSFTIQGEVQLPNDPDLLLLYRMKT